MSSSEFGLAAVYRVIKKAGAERVGDDAAIELRAELEALGVQIAKRAVTLAAHAGRLTWELERTVKARTARLADEVEKHKETVELLQESVALFKQVTENITDVFWVTDPADQEIYRAPDNVSRRHDFLFRADSKGQYNLHVRNSISPSTRKTVVVKFRAVGGQDS
jgi:histone H3/H4